MMKRRAPHRDHRDPSEVGVEGDLTRDPDPIAAERVQSTTRSVTRGSVHRHDLSVALVRHDPRKARTRVAERLRCSMLLEIFSELSLELLSSLSTMAATKMKTWTVYEGGTSSSDLLIEVEGPAPRRRRVARRDGSRRTDRTRDHLRRAERHWRSIRRPPLSFPSHLVGRQRSDASPLADASR